MKIFLAFKDSKDKLRFADTHDMGIEKVVEIVNNQKEANKLASDLINMHLKSPVFGLLDFRGVKVA